MSKICLEKNALNMTPKPIARPSHRRAFSLIEVIVAVMIVALLAALVVPRFAGLLRSSTRRTAQIEVNALHRQVDLFMIQQSGGSLPDDFMLEELAEGEDPFLNSTDDLVDPWNNPYVIVIPGDYNLDFDVVSYGKDGQPGGETEAEDVISNKD
jgi:general secretion pathway protein G